MARWKLIKNVIWFMCIHPSEVISKGSEQFLLIFLPMQGLMLEAITTNSLIIPFIMIYASIFFSARIVNHVLRGSAIPGSTATGLVNGKCNFRPPQNAHTLTDHQKNWYRWLRLRPLRLCRIWCKSAHGGLLGKWVKYNEKCFYL